MAGQERFLGMTPEPVLLWQDAPGLITNVGLIPGQTAEDGSIVVSTADKVGNALIGLRIGGEIRWSWHIWVTRYDPNAELVAFGKIYTWDNNGDGVADYTFMDRNLGAVIDKGAHRRTHRPTRWPPADCCIQWGRKDPFPGDRILRGTNQTDYNRFDSKPIYDAAGTLLTEGSQSGGTGIRTIRTSEDLTRTNFAKSIFSPMHFLLADNWFPSEEPLKVEACDTLWYGARGKTPFDPCRRGGVSRRTRTDCSHGTDSTRPDRLFATRGLFLCRIPLPRRWRMPEEFGIQYRYLDSGYLPALHLHHSLRPTSQHKKETGGYRSDGYSVRCAKDE